MMRTFETFISRGGSGGVGGRGWRYFTHWHITTSKHTKLHNIAMCYLDSWSYPPKSWKRILGCFSMISGGWI